MPLTVEEYMNLPPVTPDRIVHYGDDAEQFGHLYAPPGVGPHPVIILIHGGCWRAQYGLEPLGSLCAALRDLGACVWSIEYRRLGGSGENRGGWPVTFLDVALAADHVRSLAGEDALDPARVITMGHSAGGHLALWLAARHRLPATSELHRANPLPVSGVISLAGIPDLARAVDQRICGTAPQELLGGRSTEVPERYAQGSPAQLLPLGVPQRLISGVDDSTVPVSYVESYYETALSSGEDVRLAVVEGAHFEPVAPDTSTWPVLVSAVQEMLALR